MVNFRPEYVKHQDRVENFQYERAACRWCLAEAKDNAPSPLLLLAGMIK
jgi:hypothetical protein